MTKKPKRLAITPRLKKSYSSWIDSESHRKWLCHTEINRLFKISPNTPKLQVEAFAEQVPKAIAVQVKRRSHRWYWRLASKKRWPWRLAIKRPWKDLFVRVEFRLDELFPKSRKIEKLWIRLLYEE